MGARMPDLHRTDPAALYVGMRRFDKPQQNAYVERFNRTVRYDWLNQYIFETIEEVQEAETTWL